MDVRLSPLLRPLPGDAHAGLSQMFPTLGTGPFLPDLSSRGLCSFREQLGQPLPAGPPELAVTCCPCITVATGTTSDRVL